MKKLTRLTALLLVLGVGPVYAHHPAADIVDEEIYAMIDALVADTPHAEMTFDEMGGGMTEATLVFPSVDAMEDAIQRGDLLEYLQYLDGVVDVSLSFNPDMTVTLTINQVR